MLQCVLEIQSKIDKTRFLGTKGTGNHASKSLYEISMVELYVSMRTHLCHSAGIGVIMRGALWNVRLPYVT